MSRLLNASLLNEHSSNRTGGQGRGTAVASPTYAIKSTRYAHRSNAGPNPHAFLSARFLLPKRVPLSATSHMCHTSDKGRHGTREPSLLQKLDILDQQLLATPCPSKGGRPCQVPHVPTKTPRTDRLTFEICNAR